MVIPRVTSSIMMHLICEPDIRDGINIMKYVLNHPYKFRVIRTDGNVDPEDKFKYRGLSRRVFAAFLLGFCQASIGIIAEVLVILFLSTQSSLLDIIRKFVSMSIIVKFDNLYAAALSEHSIVKAKGKKLKVFYKRQYSEKQMSHVEREQLSPDLLSHHSVSEKTGAIDNPRRRYPLLHLMRLLYKLCRMYYLSFGYYFMPMSAMLLNFMQNTRSISKFSK